MNININIKTITNRDLKIKIADNLCVSDLKETIESQEGIPPLQQRLIFNGRPLNDDSKLMDVNMKDGDKVVVEIDSIGRLENVCGTC